MRKKCLSVILATVMMGAVLTGCSKSEDVTTEDVSSVASEGVEEPQESEEPEEEVIEEVVEEVEEVQPFVPGKWEGGINQIAPYLPYEVKVEWNGVGESAYDECIDRDNFELVVEPEELLNTMLDFNGDLPSAHVRNLEDGCIEIGVNIKGLGSCGDRYIVKEINGKYKVLEQKMASNFEAQYDYIYTLTCEYDDEGRVISQIDRYETNDKMDGYYAWPYVQTYTYEYDGDDIVRMTMTYETDGPKKGRAISETYNRECDSNGNVIKQTKTYEYDENDKNDGKEELITKETNTYEYDENGELIKNTYICEAGADSNGYEWSIEMLSFPDTVEHPLVSGEMHFPEENVPGTEIICKITLKKFDGTEVPEDALCSNIKEKECTFVFEEK